MGKSVVFPADKRGLNPKEITIAEILKKAGYATGCFGWRKRPEHSLFQRRGSEVIPSFKGNNLFTITDDAITDAAVHFINQNKDIFLLAVHSPHILGWPKPKA